MLSTFMRFCKARNSKLTRRTLSIYMLWQASVTSRVIWPGELHNSVLIGHIWRLNFYWSMSWKILCIHLWNFTQLIETTNIHLVWCESLVIIWLITWELCKQILSKIYCLSLQSVFARTFVGPINAPSYFSNSWKITYACEGISSPYRQLWMSLWSTIW